MSAKVFHGNQRPYWLNIFPDRMSSMAAHISSSIIVYAWKNSFGGHFRNISSANLPLLFFHGVLAITLQDVVWMEEC